MGEYRTRTQSSEWYAVASGSERRRTKRHFILLLWAGLYGAAVLFLAEGPAPAQAAPAVSSLRPDDLNAFQFLFGDAAEDEEPGFGEPGYAGPNCTLPSVDNFPPDWFSRWQREHGAIVLHFLASFYVFYALLLVCDDYFVPSIEAICSELKIQPATAGATFMAISTSAPELFTNVIGTFVTKGDLGVGTIVGSAVFNILAVGAFCGLGAGMAVNKIRGEDGRVGVPLEWWPLTRDCLFYTASVVVLLVVLANRRVYWYEALAMILFYLVYILVMVKNSRVQAWAERVVYAIRDWGVGVRDRKPQRLSVTIRKVKRVKKKSGGLFSEKEPLLIFDDPKRIGNGSLDSCSSSNEHLHAVSATILDEMLLTKALGRSESHCVEEKERWGLWSFPPDAGLKTGLEWVLGWPIRLLFTLTIPDCRETRFRKWYPLTLVMCVVWIAGLTYVVSWMMSIIGDTLQIPDSVTGLTFLAAGTSIPEVISSIIVARQGFGTMGLSNSIGSNTFDLLVCLGLPWLIETAILAESSTDYVKINSAGLEYSILLLITSVVVFYVIIATNGFLLDAKVGIASLLMYAVFLSLACLLEMNVFFPVNLPICHEGDL